MSTPVVTIFVRHKPGCKWEGEEFAKGCKCRKHFRWSQDGKQFRRKAGTRSWIEAEEQKRRLEDQLAGRTPALDAAADARTVQSAVYVFLQDKKVQGVTASVMGKYTRELSRLREY